MRWTSSYSSVGRSKYHLWRSLNLFKNSPVDVQGFCTVSCSPMPFHCSTGKKMSLDQVSPQGCLHYFTLFFVSDTSVLSSDDRFGEFNGFPWAVGFQGPSASWDGTLTTRLLDIARVSLVEIIEPFQEFSNWCSRLLHSLVLFCAFRMLHRAKRALHQVSPQGSLHYFTCFFASYTIILSSNDRFWQFNGQWVFEDLLLHEIKAFLPDFGCCKNHLWRSLKLVRNPPIDVQGFSKVSCSLVSFKCSTGQKSLFIKWVLRVVCITLHSFLL